MYVCCVNRKRDENKDKQRQVTKIVSTFECFDGLAMPFDDGFTFN